MLLSVESQALLGRDLWSVDSGFYLVEDGLGSKDTIFEHCGEHAFKDGDWDGVAGLVI